MMHSEPKAFADDSDEELIAYYLEWTEEAIQDLSNLIAAFKANAASETAERIYEISHNIKGMGSSFGFPLMTETGRSICFYLRRCEGETLDASVLEAHLKSFKLILSKRMTGDGGQLGKDLVTRLNQLVEHMLAA